MSDDLEFEDNLEESYALPLVSFLLKKYGLQITKEEAEKILNDTASVENICLKEETADWEKEAEELYPFSEDTGFGRSNTFRFNEDQSRLKEAHIRSCQMHRNDGLDELIEWVKEYINNSDYTDTHYVLGKVITKANEIKSK